MVEIEKASKDIEGLEILDLLAWMDGGSITLQCRNREGIRIEIWIQQHMILEKSPYVKLPGRIYINDLLVKRRSPLEQSILEELKRNIPITKNQLDKRILIETIDFIESEKYMKL
jgi:hypothetical protein